MNWKPKEFDQEQYNDLKSAGLVPLFCTLLSNRAFSNVRTKSDVELLVTCPFKMMESPNTLPNIEPMRDIFLDSDGKDAVMFGDYDVDGVVSCFMCERLLLEIGSSSVDVYLPSRIDDGYGLNSKSVDHFLTLCKKDYKLVVVLDCGSSSEEQIKKIKKHLPNAKVVVIDHHIIEESTFSESADAVVNPRMNDSTPYCTGGLMYQLVRSCMHKVPVSIELYLAYSAIATISDVCEMTNGNRTIVRNGLEAMSSITDPGLLALLEISEINPKNCCTEDISFRIGPLLNASGRIEVANVAYKLLKSATPRKAKENAKKLHELNEKRKKMQNAMADEAIEFFEKNGKNRKSALLYFEHWNPGIVGIVASKIVDRFQVPTICFGSSNGEIKGSARSVKGINIKEVMDMCKHLFIKYGGHEMAAGATLDPICLDTAWDTFNESVMLYMGKNMVAEPAIFYDYEVDPDLLIRIDSVFCERLVKLEPYGSGNETPVFLAKNVFCADVKEWSSGKGGFVKLDNVGLNCFAFGPDLKNRMEGKSVDILFSLARSFVRGEKWQIKIIDVK
jgi:single-stranded-DNA-specific exonuclease